MQKSFVMIQGLFGRSVLCCVGNGPGTLEHFPSQRLTVGSKREN